MADPDELALSYLLPPSLSFWHWQDRGDAVAWIDGGTIAFREALIVVLERLAPRGLPPLSCVLLLLAACRDNWREGRRETGRIDGIPLPLTVPRQQERERTQIAGVVAALDRIHTFDRKYRTNIEMVAVMAELVFENAAVRTTTETSQTVIAALRAGIIADVSDHHAMRAEPQPSFDSEMKILLGGLPLATEDAIESRLHRGVEQDLAPVPLDLPPAERIRRLIDDLQTDIELSGVARLARKLLAALSVLRPVSAPDELALGGVSDITNRGPLDRLLLSELAHDDLTLATRIAMGEALYLRREAPPSDPPAVRSILIDAGLRLWGIPRLFAAAVGMAFSAVDRTVDVSAFRASCNKIVPVDLTTRAGLLAHLESLEPELHPGACLAPFRTHLDEADETLEPILITHADTLDDADFRQTLAASRFDVLWIASLDRTGSFSLHSFTPSGRKLLREARFSLNDILEPPKQPAKPVAPIVDVNWITELPLIFDVTPFPLRLRFKVDPIRTWSILPNYEFLSMTRDRQLYYWGRTDRGGILFHDRLPGSRLHFVEDSSRCIRQVFIGSNNNRLHRIGLHVCGKFRSSADELVGEFPTLQGVDRCPGGIFVLEDGRVHFIGPEGANIATCPIDPSLRWKGQNFFYHQGNHWWHSLSYDGTGASFDAVCRRSGSPAGEVRMVFNSLGIDGPLAINNSNSIFNLATGASQSIDVGFEWRFVAGISRDGQKIAVRDLPDSTRQYNLAIWDVPKSSAGRRWRMSASGQKGCVDRYRPPETEDDLLREIDGISSIAEPTNNPRHFRQIGATANCLWLRTKGGNNRRISFARNAVTFEEMTYEELATIDACPVAQLNAFQSHRPFAFDVRVAKWPDGSHAFADSRGLLHLRSSNTRLPQISIVLNEGETSGWCSDGRMWGDPFHIGDHPKTRAEEIFATVIRPFVERVSAC